MFYACVVAGVTFLCHCANHKTLKLVAVTILIGWVGSIVAYFALSPAGYTWGYSVISFAQALFFWRLSAASLLPKPLFLLSACAIVLNALATVASLDLWWSAFALNRLFDLMLAYVAGCALFRTMRMRHKKKGAPQARPQSSEIFAAG